tara:strand:+ start:29442 stop:30389 length:948 start_codon:yes stop_codon:yes gene_type:complete
VALILKYYKNFISLFVFVIGLTYLFYNAEVHHIAGLDWRIGIGVIILHGLFYFLLTIPQLYILRNLNTKVNLGQLFSITILTNFLNLLLPARGGIFLRGIIFHKNYGMKKRDYAAFSLFMSLTGLFVMGALGVVFFPLMDWDGEKPSVLLIGGASSLMLFGFYGLYSTKALAKWSKKIEVLYHEKTNWSKINKKRNFITTSLFYGASALSHAARIYLLSLYFYLELDFFDVSGLTILLLLINTVPILPGNIGVKEVSLSGILSLMGHNPQIGFFIAIVDRVMELIFLGILGVIFSFKWNIWNEWGKTNQDLLKDE